MYVPVVALGLRFGIHRNAVPLPSPHAPSLAVPPATRQFLLARPIRISFQQSVAPANCGLLVAVPFGHCISGTWQSLSSRREGCRFVGPDDVVLYSLQASRIRATHASNHVRSRQIVTASCPVRLSYVRELYSE